MKPTTIVATLAATLTTALATPAWAFPDKPLTLIVPYPPGGATDIVGRILAKGLTQRLGQTVVVDNKAGAGTAIGASALAKAPADGYTLLISSNTTFTINPAVKATLPYDPVRQFEGIGVVGSSPLVLLAHPAFAASTVKGLVTQAKAKPGAISYASFGSATSSHFAGEMFKLATGTELLHVPYKGSAPAMQDLIGGQVQLSVDTLIAAKPQVAAGRVKAIALTSARRSAGLPGVPTVAESGYPGFAMEPWVGVVAPRGLPRPVQAQLAKALADTVADPATRAELEKTGMDVQYEPPASYDTRLAAELPLMRATVHKARISAE
jgi:tripartite-type tricarboxylate transporter receptor subunit TctC